VSHIPWLSGTASWSYFAATHYILGIRPEVEGLRIDPCIPPSWDGFKVSRNFRGKRVFIQVNNPSGVCKGVKSISVNRERLDTNLIPEDLLEEENEVKVVLG